MTRKLIVPLLLLALLLTGCAMPGVREPDTAQVSSVSSQPKVSPEPTNTPLPTPAPTPPPQPDYEARAREILRGLSLREKICQMLIVRPDDLSGNLRETECGEELKNALEEYPVGGIVLFSANMTSVRQTEDLIKDLQDCAGIDLFISVDEEGGDVARIAPALGTTELLPMFEYREKGAEAAYGNAQTIAEDISGLGFNFVFAPVADVWTNPENTVIGTRAYSDDPLEASMLVASAVRGFQEAGVISTLKHFPGHGDTEQDTHDGSAYSAKTLDELRKCEFLPFIAGIDAGAEAVMTSHVTLPLIDPYNPSTFSAKIIDGLLRKDLGFEGLILTDALDMKALSVYSPVEVAVLAVEAGTDILLGPKDIGGIVSAIEERVAPGRIDESVMRILTLKLKYGIIE